MKKVKVTQRVKPIYFIDSLHKELNISRIHNFDDYGLQIMKTQNSVSQKIWILHNINKKWYFRYKCQASESMLMSMHSILGWASFYIYIYAFSRRFYPKRLTLHSDYTYFLSVCVPWELNPQPFVLLTQYSTTEPQEHLLHELLHQCGVAWRQSVCGTAQV